MNLNASYRAVLYAPNSPVVVVGDHQDDFRGFIVAKNYLRLKDDDDFVDSGEVRYFNNPSRKHEYERKIKSDGTIYFQNLGGTKISTSITKDEQPYRLKIYYAKDDPETAPAKKKRYYKVYGKNSTCPDGSTEVTVTIDGKTYACFTKTDENGKELKYIKTVEENGIEMYVDDYGDVQYAEMLNPPTKCGVYDNFGRTDFTTHNYQVAKESATNLILSGN
ncbi:MAG: hypothetical protein IKE46_01945 [Selenomonadaceae bacterium]|nr:hypothetical protein [Selenomonadaceae bacterium]